jgi:RNA polymerase sigma-70 factor (ECF subfamily)
MEQEIRARLDERRYREALELLLLQYQNKVFHLAYAILGNRALAEETAQEVFMRIWRALPGYRGQASLSTWIYAITRNTSITALRRVSKNAVSIEDPKVRLAVETRHSTKQTECVIDLPSLLSTLPERYRQVLTLFYTEEKSYKEVARQLDLPVGTVKTCLHRARRDLALAISKERRGER